MSGVEIRVHGIGDHKTWSSLGSPPVRHPTKSFDPEIVLPPVLPAHDLELVNWSRTSRGAAGLLWYVALPYTLVNVAGEMLPNGEDETGRQRGRVVVLLVGVLLTLCTYIWSVALLETVVRRLFVQLGSSPWSGYCIAVLTGLALAAGMVIRRRRRGLDIRGGLLWAHVGVVAIASAVACSRPAHWAWDAPAGLRWLTTVNPLYPGEADRPCLREAAECPQTTFDPVTATALAAIAITLLLVAGIAVQMLWRARSIPKSPAGSSRRIELAARCGLSVALAAAVLLLNSVASALRLFADNGTKYLSDHGVLLWQERGASSASFEGRGVLPGLLATPSAARDDFVIDALPLLGLLALVMLSVALVAVNAFAEHGAGRLPLRRGASRARWAHCFTVQLPWTLPTASLLALTGLVLAAAAGGAWLLGTETSRWWDISVAVIQGVSVLTAAIVLARPDGAVRKVSSRIADVLGFWPVRSHPLGGASYRDSVVSAVCRQVGQTKGPVALVGHSQGSVLVAWAISTLNQPNPRLLLVTCGSPLRSLYGTFFPRYFDDHFFERARSQAQAGWANFWRPTDPIATKLNGAGIGIDDAELEDPSGGELRVHDDYWKEKMQVARVNSHLVGGGSTPAPAQLPSSTSEVARRA